MDNAAAHEVSAGVPVAPHDDMRSEETSLNVLGRQAHVPEEPEQKMDPNPGNPLEGGEANPYLHEPVPAAAEDVIDLENIPVHLVGLDAIKKGAPIGRGGMSTVFNGKYGPIPVALKQAAYSVQVLLNEAAIITKMQHLNVIQTYGIWKNAKQEVFMVYDIL